MEEASIEGKKFLVELHLGNNSFLPPRPCCVEDGGDTFPLGGQHEVVCIFQSHARVWAESVKSNRDWTADRIVEVVVLPDDLSCSVFKGSLLGGFYHLG